MAEIGPTQIAEAADKVASALHPETAREIVSLVLEAFWSTDPELDSAEKTVNACDFMDMVEAILDAKELPLGFRDA